MKSLACFIAGMLLSTILLALLSGPSRLSLEQMKYEIISRFAGDAARRGLDVQISSESCSVESASIEEAQDGIDLVVTCIVNTEQGDVPIFYSVTATGAQIIVEGWEELR